MPTRKVVIAGGTGFVGSALVTKCLDEGFEVCVLSRRPDPTSKAKVVVWDGRSLGEWAYELDGAEALINLSGEPVSQKWSGVNRRRILDSRIESTQALCEAISKAQTKPKTWINTSAVGYYGNRGEETLDESSSSGQGFLAEVCVKWENAFFACPHVPQKRAVRFGMVLGNGGALAPLKKLAKLGLAGTVGSGDQYVSWIHIDDLVGIILRCLGPDVPSVVNTTAPGPVTNRVFMKAIRVAVGAPFGIPTPSFAMRLVGNLIGPGPDLVLNGAKVMPKAMMDLGYIFRYSQLGAALEKALG